MSLYTLQNSAANPVALNVVNAPPSYATCKSSIPFTVYLSAEDNIPKTVHLYAQNSKSEPYQSPQNKWSHLIPEWRFTDLSGNYINDLIMYPATGLFSDVYTASAQVYYIDDLPTSNCLPVLLWFIVDYQENSVWYDNTTELHEVSGYSNSKVGQCIPYFVNSVVPTDLKITKDGILDLQTTYWKNTQIPHVITVNSNQTILYDNDSNGIMYYIPYTNYFGFRDGIVNRTLEGVELTAVTWDPSTLDSYLSAHDYQDFKVGGYIRSIVKSSEAVENACISATVTVTISDASITMPYLWVSNPEYGKLHLIYTPCISSTLIDSVTSFIEKEKFKGYYYEMLSYEAPIITTIPIDNPMGLSGFGGIFGIATNSDFSIWCTDSEMDAIYKYDTFGTRLCTIMVSSISVSALTPAGISLDSNYDFWVTLFDSPSLLKFDKYGTHLITVDCNYDLPIEESFDPLRKPPLAETDKEDNIWVSYSNPLCSCLYKYDTNGMGPCSIITLPLCSCPMDILIDANNDVWVTLTDHSVVSALSYSGEVVKYSNAIQVSSFNAVHPEYIAMDESGNIWFTQDYNTVTRITVENSTTTDFKIGQGAMPWVTAGPLLEYNALEGIASITDDKIYVINSVENTLYQISDSNVSTVTLLYSAGPLNHYFKSAQAFGDWTGVRWQIKYGVLSHIISGDSMTLYGSSDLFDIEDYTGYDIRRYNESWNANEWMSNLYVQPHIKDNPVLWNGIMESAIGTDQPYSGIEGDGGGMFGRTVYEKAANYTKNHADISHANIDSVYSMAHETDVSIDDYGLVYPPELKRIMDIISVNQQYLWGSRCGCNKNIRNEYRTYLSGSELIEVDYLCDKCNHLHPGNRGSLFNPSSYIVTAYQPFIVRDAYLNLGYELITPPLSCEDIYNQSYIWSDITRSFPYPEKYFKYVAISDSGLKLVVIASIDVNTNGKMYISDNGGITWRSSSIKNVIDGIGQVDWRGLTLSSDGQIIYACEKSSGGTGGYMYRSLDGGVTWNYCPPILPYEWVYLEASSNGHTAIASTLTKIQYTFDIGDNWYEKYLSFGVFINGVGVSENGENLTFCTFGNYISTYSIGTPAWTQITNSTDNWQSITISNDGQTILVGRWADHPQITLNGGTTWTSITSLPLYTVPLKMAMNDTIFYMSRLFYNSNGFYTSFSNGDRWKLYDVAVNGSYPPAKSPSYNGLFILNGAIGNIFIGNYLREKINVNQNLCDVFQSATSCISTYPLSESYYWLLPHSYTVGITANEKEFNIISDRYCFYEYIPVQCDTQIAGDINWDDSYTTLDETISGIEDWLGSEKTVEKIINYTLHKGLGLIDE